MTSARDLVLRAEQLLGGLTPYSSERVIAAIDAHGEAEIVRAIDAAERNGARNWAYVEAVLNRKAQRDSRHSVRLNRDGEEVTYRDHEELMAGHRAKVERMLAEEDV